MTDIRGFIRDGQEGQSWSLVQMDKPFAVENSPKLKKSLGIEEVLVLPVCPHCQGKGGNSQYIQIPGAPSS